jgi:hypothetical protein
MYGKEGELLGTETEKATDGYQIGRTGASAGGGDAGLERGRNQFVDAKSRRHSYKYCMIACPDCGGSHQPSQVTRERRTKHQASQLHGGLVVALTKQSLRRDITAEMETRP